MEPEIIKWVLQGGATVVLLLWVWDLKKQVKDLSSRYDTKNTEHISDIKAHKDEFGAIIQTTPPAIQKMLDKQEQKIKEWINDKYD